MAKLKGFRPVGIGVAALSVLLGLLASGGCVEQEQKPEHEVAYLLVQSSDGFEYDGERMTLLGVSPTTVFFSDRPDRIAGHMPIEKAYEWGQAGDDSFLVNPPNATISILEAGEMGNVVVTMSNGVIEGDRLSFDVKILEGELPERGGPNTVFIDIIGRPLTPLSVAGMHRRTRRRSLAVGMAVGASVGAASTAQASQAANSAAPSVDQQLAQLKEMLDKGLITQQDYDAKKKQLLGEM
jgi:hypothetical protein